MEANADSNQQIIGNFIFPKSKKRKEKAHHSIILISRQKQKYDKEKSKCDSQMFAEFALSKRAHNL